MASEASNQLFDEAAYHDAQPGPSQTARSPAATRSRTAKAKAKAKVKTPAIDEPPVSGQDQRGRSRSSQASSRHSRRSSTAELRALVLNLAARIEAMDTRDSVLPTTEPYTPARRFATPGELDEPRYSHDEPRLVIRVDNPPHFTGTRDGPALKDWIHLTHDKMRVVPHSFPNEAIRFTWLKSLIRGPALEALRPYLDMSNPGRFKSCQQIYQFLQDVFSDPDEEAAARDELLHLEQGSLSFYEFGNRFVQLATNSRTAMSEWKKLMNRKLNTKLREAVLGKYMDDSVTFAAFRAYCSAVDQQLREIARHTRNKMARLAAARTSTPSTSPSTSRFIPMSKVTVNPIAASRSPATGSQQCYNCRQPGHLAANCPLPRKPAVAYVAAEREEPDEDPYATPLEVEEDTEVAESSESSGKVLP